MNWEPISEHNNIRPISHKISEIAKYITKNTNKIGVGNIELLDGKAGIAIFLFYYSKFKDRNRYDQIASELIYDTLNCINDAKITFSSNTLSRIGWAINHLSQNGFLDANLYRNLGAMDKLISQIMLNETRNGNEDLLTGSICKGVYFLDHNSASSKKYLVQFVDELKIISTLQKNSKNEISNQDFDSKPFWYYLGLSHGIACRIAFLSKIYNKKYNTNQAQYHLNNTIKYLLSQQLNKDQFLSKFPVYSLEMEKPKSSRLGWCHGDLGIGIALLQAGQATKNTEWKNKAIEILLHSTKRKVLKDNFVLDAGLCHGTSGIAHIYNRAFFFTKIPEFKESANYWYKETLKMANNNKDFAGFKIPQINNWITEVNFIHGIAGIGLALISAVSNIEPKWDRCLLLS